MATETVLLKTMIALQSGKEFEFKTEVELKSYREHDDYRTWEEIEIYSTVIEDLTAEEAQEILNGTIDCVYIEDCDYFDGSEDYVFGGRKVMLEYIKEVLMKISNGKHYIKVNNQWKDVAFISNITVTTTEG